MVSDILTNIERVRLGTGAVTPFQELNVVVGTPGNDPALNGTAGNDLIIGLGGNDTLNGFAGNDILVGGRAWSAVSVPLLITLNNTG